MPSKDPPEFWVNIPLLDCPFWISFPTSLYLRSKINSCEIMTRVCFLFYCLSGGKAFISTPFSLSFLHYPLKQKPMAWSSSGRKASVRLLGKDTGTKLPCRWQEVVGSVTSGLKSWPRQNTLKNTKLFQELPHQINFKIDVVLALLYCSILYLVISKDFIVMQLDYTTPLWREVGLTQPTLP